ncbi:Response regulator/sensor histidine kinase [Labilithrix luteola]|uniref:histidine kinase n=1 Tax=Labilithrix luteola TaxID=1391654 RepID=A0A0K1QG52_9BACT|nr:HAMP domain-containing sensor histidine kinase [Labilithrix luteola]AKV04415.1 Response regulator/sensor histidine kinase [Labilithrix luteola]
MTRSALGIRAKFLIAGALLVCATAVSSAWSVLAFHDMSRVVDATLHDSEQTTAATASLATALEREDDALLLTLTDEARGRRSLEATRKAVADALARLGDVLTEPGEPETYAAVKRDVDAYHRAGDALVAHARDPEARLRYHEEVNPLLRRAVGETARIRDEHFRSAQSVATWARDRAVRSTEVLFGVTLAALAFSVLVASYVARTVVVPIRNLTGAVEAMRRGDFDRRVPSDGADELGRLAGGFNRMAEDLGAFRKANVGEVLRAKETLEATLAALPDAVVVVGPDGTVASANPTASSVLRVEAGQLSKGLDALPIADRTRALLRDVLDGRKAGAAGAVDLTNAVAIDVGGSKRKLLPRVVPITGLPDGQRGAVLILSDVTELARLDEMRTELIAVASHELRTPLTTFRMTLLMLNERALSLTDRDRELVHTALLGVEQLAGTIDEFLDLTRIEAGQLRLNWDRVDVAALVAREASAVQTSCKESGIELVVDGAERTGLTIRGDAARLHVVLANLLANAMKYTPAGGTIRLGVDEVADRIVVAVEDSGPGVPAEFRERIFEKFFRVEHHRAGDAGLRGSGIGLYIAREIVEAHGGTLRYEEREGGGARLVMQLPR